MKYDPNTARRAGYDRGGGKVDLNMVSDVDLPEASSKKHRRLVLWNARQLEYGTVWHVRVNFFTFPYPVACVETDCPYCRLTRKWNKAQTMVCQRCKEERPRSKFPMDTRGRRRRSVCGPCARAQEKLETKTARAYAETPTKKCSRCTMVKTKGEFYRHPRAADGYDSNCKDCKIAGSKARWKDKK